MSLYGVQFTSYSFCGLIFSALGVQSHACLTFVVNFVLYAHITFLYSSSRNRGVPLHPARLPALPAGAVPGRPVPEFRGNIREEEEGGQRAHSHVREHRRYVDVSCLFPGVLHLYLHLLHSLEFSFHTHHARITERYLSCIIGSTLTCIALFLMLHAPHYRHHAGDRGVYGPRCRLRNGAVHARQRHW